MLTLTSILNLPKSSGSRVSNKSVAACIAFTLPTYSPIVLGRFAFSRLLNALIE